MFNTEIKAIEEKERLLNEQIMELQNELKDVRILKEIIIKRNRKGMVVPFNFLYKNPDVDALIKSKSICVSLWAWIEDFDIKNSVVVYSCDDAGDDFITNQYLKSQNDSYFNYKAKDLMNITGRMIDPINGYIYSIN